MVLLKFLSLIALALVTFSGCTTTAPVPVAERVPNRTAPAALPDDRSQKSQEGHKSGSADCLSFSALVDEIPHFFPDVGVVVTDVMKSCETTAGKPGYQQATGWVAMGFPCSGGGGRIDWRGSFHTPNLVIFQVANSCPMSPGQQQMVESLVRPRLGIGDDSRLMAYYPFAISYWEMADGSDADTSYTIEVVTTGSRQNRWTAYRAGKAIPVRLFGRPNALIPSKFWYEVSADFMQVTEETFKIEVREVKVLEDEALAQVKKRCLALTPARNCRQAFP